MEKVYIKPSSQEINIRGASSDGHLDTFAYDPSDEASKKLGHLFIVGHVQHETDDMAYAINLISALAKREYYARTNIPPKEAFGATLKKINEVVEEFFEHKGVKINIGIFAIAGEQMYISKLGKFKVLLARDEKTIDVLNNIMFDKEKVQEKQFSSVISGQVNEKDRILAYYPARGVIARERYLKMYLHKFDPLDFVEQIKKIKKEKNSFSCAMVYVHLDKVKETASAPRIEPQELQAQAVIAHHKEVSAKSARKIEHQEPIEPEPVAEQAMDEAESEEEEVSVKDINSTPKRPVEINPEVPRIISTEFSLGKKEGYLSSAIHRIRFNHLSPKNRAVLSLTAVVLIIGASLGIQSLVTANPETRAVQDAINNATQQLELARMKINQDDSTGAREILNASLASLADSDNEGVVPLRSELQELLDEIDQIADAAPSLALQLPTDFGTVTHLGVSAKYITAYAQGAVIVSDGDSQKKTDVPNTVPTRIVFSSKGTPALVDIENQKTVAIKASLEIATFSLPQPVLSSYFYEDNLYSVNPDGIYKAADVFKGDSTGKSWLKKDVPMATDPFRMAVDGRIYLMNAQGTLSTYYQGERENVVATGLAVTADHQLLSSNEGLSLYLFNKKTGRISVLDKKTGTLLKTLRIGSEQSITAAAISPNGTVYFVTADNKVWKITVQ